MRTQIKMLLVVLPISMVVVLLIFLSQRNNTLNSQNLTNEKVKTDSVITGVVKETLAILPQRCRGCGRCVMTDPEHFRMNGRTAMVISQQNLTSTKLHEAIRFCPGNAISLE